MSDEIADLLRRELDLGCAVFIDFDSYVQFSNAKPVSDILALQDEENGLAFLKRDFARSERELGCGDLDPLWCGLRNCRYGKDTNQNEQRSDREAFVLPVHNSPFQSFVRCCDCRVTSRYAFYGFKK